MKTKYLVQLFLGTVAVATTLLSSASIAASNNPVEFSLAWEPVAGATHYQLEERDAAGVWKPVSANPIVGTSFKLTRSEGIYTYRIGGCVQEPFVKIHCGTAVAYYSNSLIVDTNKLTEKANPAGSKTPSSNVIPTLTLDMEQTASLGGAFRVDESGSATYSLPLELPRGIAGVTPEVSLNYHSQAGNGVLGMGWSLNASSSIARCKQTPVQEGSFKPIDFTLDDRFCLDGQKLILTDGQFGQRYSKYKTEINAFVDVEITQSGTHGPYEFKVTGKDGSIRYFGGTDNSTIKNANTTTSTQWLLREARDNLDNVVNSVSYQYKTYGLGEVVLDTISYSGNTVSFNYSQNRPDKSEAYSLGQLVEQTTRLESISTQNQSKAALFSYHIQYLDETASNTANTSLIDNIKQCAGGLSSNVCLAPISFEWEKGLTGYKSTANTTALNATNKVVVGINPIALKGDHKGIAYVTAEGDGSKYYLHVLKNTGQTLQQVFSSGVLVSHPKQYQANFDWKIIDINGDGYSEILFKTLDSSGRAIWKYYSQNSQDLPYSLSPLSMLPTGDEKLEYYDINGDGLGDLVASQWGRKTTYHLGNGYTFAAGKDFYIEQNQYTPDASSFNDIYKSIQARNAFDINQDGLADYIVPVFERCEETSAQTCKPWSETTIDGWSYYTFLTTSIDAQGKLSLVPHGSLVLKPKGGSRFEHETDRTDLGNNNAHVVRSDEGWSNLNLKVDDYNDDGIADVYYELDKGVYFTDGGKKLLFGTGTGFSAPVNYEDYVGKLEKLTERASVSATKFYFDLDGNGFDDQIEVRTTDNKLVVNYDLNLGTTDYKANEYKITSFSDSLNNVTSVTYKPLSDRSVYTPGYTAHSLTWNNGRVFDIKGGGVVVASATSFNETVNYTYQGAKIQAGGRGSLGFERISTTYTQGGDSIVTTTTYAQNYPFIGMPLTTIKTYNGNEIGRATNTLKAINKAGELVTRASNPLEFNKAPYYPYVAQSTDSNSTVNSDGSIVPTGTVTHRQTVDSWGNVLTSSTTTELNNKTATKTATNTYGDGSNLDYKRFGRVTDTTVVHSQTGKSSITRTSKFEYNTNLMLEASIVEPNGNDNLYLKTRYGYDNLGNQTSVTVCSRHFASTCGELDADLTNIGDDPLKIYRQTISVYDREGRYIESKSNGQFTVAQYQNFNQFGQPQTVVDEHGQSTLIAYDSFGRQYHAYHPSGVATSTLSVFSTNGAAIGAPAIDNHDAVIITRKTTSGQPTQWQYVDARGQVIAEVKQGFEENQKIYQYFTYDSKGRLRTQSIPSFNYTASAAEQIVTDYDFFDRPTMVTEPAKTVSYTYTGLDVESQVSTSENGFTLSRSSKKVHNAFGQTTEVIETVDAVDHTIVYSYDATGNVISTSALGQVAIVTPHDSLGRKISMTDPDKGIWTYTYNALGEMVRQESQRSSSETLVVALYRDQLGRNTRKVTNDGTIIYQYNQQRPYLLESEYFEGSNGIDKTYQHDAFGRVTKVSQALDNGELYTAQTTYDEYGRVFQQFDPESGSVGCFNSQGAVFGECKGVENRYNPQGYLVSKSEAQQTTTGTIYYHVKAIDALGNVTESELGNGLKTTYTINQRTGATEGITTSNGYNAIQNLTLKFDGLGNLRERDRGTLVSSYHGKNERFGYDGFNRLTTIDGQEEVRYQDNGNISWKRNVGFYCYDASKPNQLTGLGSNVGCSSNDYRYDNHGNMLVGRGNTIAYGANSKPTSIRSRDGLSLFNYDTAGNRYKQVTTEGGKTTTTYYVGNLELVQDGEGTQVRRYLPSAIEAAYASGRTEIRYLHSDHLGSIDTITDSRGKIVEKVYFDAWGKRQSIAQAYWQTTVRALTAPELLMSTEITPRGFTGHEHIDHADIIHMNGRIYDPTLGRFLQADPHIQAPTNSQSYNRYSYVLNNPLSYTDPSGYFFKSLFKKLNKALGDFAPLLGIALLAIPGIREWTLASGWHAALFGFGTGGVATGSLKGALIGAFSGAAFHHIGGAFTEASGFFAEGGFGHILTHGVTGGITSVLSGGKFGHGFFSAGFSKFAMSNAGFNYNDISSGAIIGRTVIAGIVGGTASKISGGKFGNGAATAAMAQLFNQETSNYKNVTAQRPYSEDFWEEYLNYDDYDTAAAWETVGGSLDDGYGPYSNSCATRVSHGLNQSGAPIPRGAPGANLNFGGDNGGLRYILSARQLEVYLADAWGTPDFSNVTVEQLSSLRTSMAPNQVAIGVSPDHATVLTNSYSDKYWGLASGGSVWILPTKSN